MLKLAKFLFEQILFILLEQLFRNGGVCIIKLRASYNYLLVLNNSNYSPFQMFPFSNKYNNVLKDMFRHAYAIISLIEFFSSLFHSHQYLGRSSFKVPDKSSSHMDVNWS